MTNEELAAEIQAGTGERMAELWEQVERFVQLKARRYRVAFDLDPTIQEDLCQSGYLAMCSAVQTYDKGSGAGFLTWLSLYLRTAFREALGIRSARQQKDPIHRALSLEAPASADDEEITLCDSIPAPSPWEDVEDQIWTDQAHAVIEAALCELPRIQAEVLRLKYYDGMTCEGIAQLLGLDAGGVRLEEQKAMRVLRHGHRAAMLRALLEGQPPSYYQRIGVEQFQRTGESAVEIAVFRREQLAANL